LRQPAREHVETFAHVGLLPNLADIRVEVGHPDQRTVAERRERVEHIVARERAIAQAYSVISGSTPSRLRKPTPGSTSRCVRMCRPLQDRFLERPRRAGINVFPRERSLRFGGLADRFVQIAACGGDAIKDA